MAIMIPVHPVRRVLHVLTVGVFAAALASSRLDEFVRDDARRDPKPEGRDAVARPSWPTSLSELNQFSAEFEAYYFDTFGLRDVLMRCKTTVDYFGLGLAPSSDLVVGRDGWIFYAGEWTFENLRGVRPLDTDALEAWRIALENRRDALARAGCAYMYVVCPNKETIYRERVPSVYEALGPTRLDQIKSHLARTSSVEFLDLREAILAEKWRDAGEDTLYPAHGTHWMGRAVFAAYRAITLPLSQRFPNMHRYEVSETHFTTEMTTKDSWAPKMYLGDRLLHYMAYPVAVDGPRYVPLGSETIRGSWRNTDANGDSDGPRAIVRCDSFVDAVHEFLPDSFAEVMYVRGAPLSEAEIADFRPDVLIDLFVERCLIKPPPRHLADLPPPRGRAAEFDAAQTRLFTLDWKATSGGLIPTGTARLDVAGAEADASVSFSTPTIVNDVRLPTIVVPEASRVLLRVTGSCPTDIVLDVYWKPKDAPTFRVAWRTLIPLGPLTSSRTVELVVPAGPLDMRLRTRGTKAAATLHEFEMRAVPR